MWCVLLTYLVVIGYMTTSLTLTENSISTKDVFLRRVDLNHWDWTFTTNLAWFSNPHPSVLFLTFLSSHRWPILNLMLRMLSCITILPKRFTWNKLLGMLTIIIMNIFLARFYGLKQSPHAWYHNHLDPIYILLYVNEIIFMAFNSYLIQQVITCLSSKLYMTNLGPPSFFIDITSTCVIHGIFISLIVFAKEILS